MVNASTPHLLKIAILLILSELSSVGISLAQSWQFISPMQITRSEPCVVQLDNGLILVAGGADRNSALSSCELYDPMTNTWRFTGSLHQARYRGEMLKLVNGKVLIAGGLTDLGVSTTPTCEIFDPISETWQFTASLNEPKQNFDMITLPNGGILVAGGLNSNNTTFLNSCEVYDPISETFLPFPSMPIGHYSTNLFYSSTLNELVVPGGVIGGSAGIYFRSTQHFSFANNSWFIGDSLQVAHSSSHGQPVQMPDDRIVLISGRTGEYTTTSSVEELDYSSRHWKKIGDLIAPRFLAESFVVNNDSVLVIGGVADPGRYQQPLNTCTWFDTKRGVAFPGPPLNNARFGFRAVHYRYPSVEDSCVIIERIFVFGGGDETRSPLSTCEVLNLQNFSTTSNNSIAIKTLDIDTLGCNSLDTSILITLTGCGSLQLESIEPIDSTVCVVTPLLQLPLKLEHNTTLPINLTATSGGHQLILKLTFKNNKDQLLIRFAVVNINKVGKAAFALSSKAFVEGTICHGAITNFILNNKRCSDIVLKKISLITSDSSLISIRDIEGFQDSVIIPGGTTFTPIVKLQSAVPGEYDCKLKLQLGIGKSTIDTSIAFHLSIKQQEEFKLSSIISDKSDYFVGDTVEEPLYLLADSQYKVKGVRINLKFNTDLLKLVDPNFDGCILTPTSVYDIQKKSWGCELYVPQTIEILEGAPLIKLRFKTILTTTYCDTLRIDDIVLESIQSSICYSVARDSAEICLQPTCGDQTIQNFMKAGKMLAPNIYPNPVRYEATIKGIGNATLEIINILGNVVLSEQLNNQNEHRINVSALQPGPYIFRFSSEEGSSSRRVILSR